VPGVGAKTVLTVDGEWRKTRLFRSHEQAELVGAIAAARAIFEGNRVVRRPAAAGARGNCGQTGRCGELAAPVGYRQFRSVANSRA
jgi:hypothetical protein